MVKVDNNDQKLLELLAVNSQRSIQDLGRATGLPPTTAHNRVKRLEKLGIITGYTALIDWAKTGKAVTAYVQISVEYVLPSGVRVNQDDLVREIRGIAGVKEIVMLTGGADLLVKAQVKDIAGLNELVVKKLRIIPGVDKTQTMLVLSTF